MKRDILITGSGGLVGSEAALYFAGKGLRIIGVDNDMRAGFFGADASVRWKIKSLREDLGRDYLHHDIDIRDLRKLTDIFKENKKSIKAVIHAAAQPSHDWAAKEPQTDFTVNANGTLNLLELAREYSPETPFIFLSTNKVYGDTPNRLPLAEKEKRWEIEEDHKYYNGIDETMSIDCSMHSLFGASKAAADILTQEYGRYFGMPTASFRGGCLTGPKHSGALMHGFLSYLARCAVTGEVYTIFGYKGKQVRDNIHSYDLIRMFDEFIQNPKSGEIYNVGGSRFSSCSVLEAIELCEEITGKKIKTAYSENNRRGDHIWYISSVDKFKSHFPKWDYSYNLKDTIQEIADSISYRNK
ncbi:MAG: NAD-dependent epimerase/dehydratase family protein [Candidatus Omnitrophica bacterium]|nr:NAD-dependent epimerase/dehydratase family protein [Candidatus Omnitrophota bacterium]